MQIPIYYIIEHPTRGVLFETDTTDSGKVGRFSPTKGRGECYRFADAESAAAFRQKVTSVDPADCVIMRSPADHGKLFTRVLMGPIEEPIDA